MNIVGTNNVRILSECCPRSLPEQWEIFFLQKKDFRKANLSCAESML